MKVKEMYYTCLFQDCDRDPGGGECGVDPHPAVGQQWPAVRLHPVSDELPRSTRHRCLHSGCVLEEDQRAGNPHPTTAETSKVHIVLWEQSKSQCCKKKLAWKRKHHAVQEVCRENRLTLGCYTYLCSSNWPIKVRRVDNVNKNTFFFLFAHAKKVSLDSSTYKQN